MDTLIRERAPELSEYPPHIRDILFLEKLKEEQRAARKALTKIEKYSGASTQHIQTWWGVVHPILKAAALSPTELFVIAPTLFAGDPLNRISLFLSQLQETKKLTLGHLAAHLFASDFKVYKTPEAATQDLFLLVQSDKDSVETYARSHEDIHPHLLPATYFNDGAHSEAERKALWDAAEKLKVTAFHNGLLPKYKELLVLVDWASCTYLTLKQHVKRMESQVRHAQSKRAREPSATPESGAPVPKPFKFQRQEYFKKKHPNAQPSQQSQ